jgi:hypothetical protein
MASLLSKIGVAGAITYGQGIDHGCEGKMGYPSKLHADRTLTLKRHKKGAVTAYRCKTCDLWHVGSRMAAKW